MRLENLTIAILISLISFGCSDMSSDSNSQSDPIDIDTPTDPIDIDTAMMAFVEGGTFQMGDTSGIGMSYELPVHSVTLSSFYISKYEITNEQYCEFLNEEGNQIQGDEFWLDIGSSYCKIENVGGNYQPKSGYGNHPVIGVSWYGARAYCEWAGGRLPTEAEWEYSARGGSQSAGYRYSGSNNPDEVSWNLDNSGSQIHPVGQKQPNELGIYDMSGNSWEWCSDWYYGDYYSNSPSNNPHGPSSGTQRVIRSGAYSMHPYYCRATSRFMNFPDSPYDYNGFRIVKDYSE